MVRDIKPETGRPIELEVNKGEIRSRMLAYKAFEDYAGRYEILIAVIDGEKFAWVWPRQHWEDLVRLLARQVGDPTPLGDDDVVALIKLRLKCARGDE